MEQARFWLLDSRALAGASGEMKVRERNGIRILWVNRLWVNRLEGKMRVWEFITVKTLTVDDHKRIRIPDAEPKQVFTYENHGDGRLTLTLVSAEAKEPFPRGSLLEYLTQESNKELSALAKGSSLRLPE